MRRAGSGGVALAAVLVALVASAAPVAAQSPPPVSVPTFGGFRSVLAQGEGQSVNGADLAAYEASNKPPDTFVNQQPLYVGIMPHAGSLGPGDLNTYYKGTDFGSTPGGVPPSSTVLVACRSRRRAWMTARSAGPRCSRLRSTIDPMLSCTARSWTLTPSIPV